MSLSNGVSGIFDFAPRPRSHALRGNAVWDALRPTLICALIATRGAARLDCIPTQRVGTRQPKKNQLERVETVRAEPFGYA